MSAIALLGGLKLLIDIIEGGPSAIVKGIITSVIPGGEIFTVADSVAYIFNLDGGFNGKISTENYEQYPASDFVFINQKNLDFALSKHDFPSLAEKKFAQLNPPKFRDRDFPSF